MYWKKLKTIRVWPTTIPNCITRIYNCIKEKYYKTLHTHTHVIQTRETHNDPLTICNTIQALFSYTSQQTWTTKEHTLSRSHYIFSKPREIQVVQLHIQVFRATHVTQHIVLIMQQFLTLFWFIRLLILRYKYYKKHYTKQTMRVLREARMKNKSEIPAGRLIPAPRNRRNHRWHVEDYLHIGKYWFVNSM